MKVFAAVLLVAALTACARKVQVNTAPTPTSGNVSLHVTNNLSQAVNVYVMLGGNETLAGQVAGNSTETLPLSGVTDGTTGSLRAVTADGTHTYSKGNVVLTGAVTWSVP